LEDNTSIEKLTPAGAVRSYCTQCLGMKQFNLVQVRDCEGDQIKCPFFPYRLGKRPPPKVFRLFCIDCMGGYRDSVTDCPTVNCECYPYRFGTNPARRGISGTGNMNNLRHKSSGSVINGQISD